MNEWATRLLSVFPDRNKADLDEFILEVNNDQAEQMYIQKDLDEENECRPTFEQLSMDRIIDEANKNVNTLKAFEGIISDRMNGYNSLHSSINKSKGNFESFDTLEGSLRVALESFCLFADHEILIAKEQSFLSDLKKSLLELRIDAQKRIQDYQREIANCERELSNSEKKLVKSKEMLEKGSKLESFELDSLINVTSRLQTKYSNSNLKEKHDRSRDEDTTGFSKLEKDVKDDVRNLLKIISNRDQILAASRRAFQKLNKDCKNAIHNSLRKILQKEKEHLSLKQTLLSKLESSVDSVNIDSDVNDFILRHNHEDNSLVLCYQALSLLNDIAPHTPKSTFESGSTTPTRSRSIAPEYNQFVESPESREKITSVHPWQYTAYLSQIFYATENETPPQPPPPPLQSKEALDDKEVQPVEASHEDTSVQDIKAAHRKINVKKFSISYTDTPITSNIAQVETSAILKEATDWLCKATKTQVERDIFIAELNQFRSKKVELSAGFESLGKVLWKALENCQTCNDIRTAKVIMMLSQTFFRVRPETEKIKIDSMNQSEITTIRESISHDEFDHEHDEDGSNAKRGILHRQYINEKLMGHPIWKDGNYWEQALWQCALEQLNIIPYEKPWHDLDREERENAVRRVHDVIFSQVMAITHSMIELGCPQKLCREFLYRMCVIHQLTEAQRQQLLAHVLSNQKSN